MTNKTLTTREKTIAAHPEHYHEYISRSRLWEAYQALEQELNTFKESSKSFGKMMHELMDKLDTLSSAILLLKPSGLYFDKNGTLEKECAKAISIAKGKQYVEAETP